MNQEITIQPQITDRQIYDNRKAWIDYLKRPETKKAKSKLEDFKDPEARCCLGHACHVLIPDSRAVVRHYKEVIYEHAASYPPESVVYALGLFNAYGNTDVGSIELGSHQADS